MHLLCVVPPEAWAVRFEDRRPALLRGVNDGAAGVRIPFHNEIGFSTALELAAEMTAALFCAGIEMQNPEDWTVMLDREGLKRIDEREAFFAVVGVVDEIGDAVEEDGQNPAM